jgi:hypothetical protein
MSTVARELAVTYNGFKVGGDQANRILNEVYVKEQDFERGTVEYVFTIRHDTQAAFSAEVNAVENAFRVPRKDLTITMGGTTITDWSHANSTGYNASPKIMKWGNKQDAGYARWYRVRVEVGLPADTSETSLRRNSYVNVTYSASRRRSVTISGTYTANGATTARAQYEAVFDAYATSVLNVLGGTYKKLDEPQGTADDQNKELNFSVSYEEIIYTAIGAGDASLRGEKITIVRDSSTPGDTPANGTVERLLHLTAHYEAWFDKTVTVDLVGKWEGLKGSVVTAIQNVLTGGSVGVIGEVPDFDLANNKISVVLSCVGSTRNGICEYKETSASDIFTGNNLVGVTDGDPFSKFDYIGPGKWQVTLTQVFVTISGGDPPLNNPEAIKPPSGFKVKQISSHRDESDVRWGLPTYAQMIEATQVTVIRVYEFYKTPLTMVASGGGRRPGTTSGGVATGGGGSGGGPGQGAAPVETGVAPGGENVGMDFSPGVFPEGYFAENGGIPGPGGGSGPLARPGEYGQR